MGSGAPNDSGFDVEAHERAMIVMGLRSGERFQAIDSLELVRGENSRPFGGKATLRIGAADYDPLQEWLTTKYQIHLPSGFAPVDREQVEALVKAINAKLRIFRSELGAEGTPLASLADWFAVRGHERCARKLRGLQRRYYLDWESPPSVDLDSCAWRLGLLGFFPSDG
jgi:hypothetical protein